MKFKVLKYEVVSVREIEYDDEDVLLYQIWLELEIDGDVKMVYCQRIENIDGGGDEISFGFQNEWFLKEHHCESWVDEKDILYNNLIELFVLFDKELCINYFDSDDMNDDVIGFECEI